MTNSKSRARRIVLGVTLASILAWGAYASAGASARMAAAPGGGHHGEGRPSINWIDLFHKEKPAYVGLLANLALLVFLYYKLGKDSVAEGLVARKKAIAAEIVAAREQLADAEKRAKVYQAKWERREEDKAAVRSALVDAGNGEKERIIREAQEKAERMARDTEFLVEQEAKQALIDIRHEVAIAAVTDAESMVRANLGHDDQLRIAEEFLADLTKVKPFSTQGAA